jgi:DNA-binding NarL/FixJ family response regulator
MQSAIQQSEARHVRAVVIDDSPAFLRSLCSFLRENQDVQVVGTAKSAQEAFLLVEQSHPDLVLIDLQMPGMNGLEATALLRRRHPEARVIMITMHDTPELRQASLEGGAHGFVSKSRLSQDLPAVLEKVLAA